MEYGPAPTKASRQKPPYFGGDGMGGGGKSDRGLLSLVPTLGKSDVGRMGGVGRGRGMMPRSESINPTYIGTRTTTLGGSPYYENMNKAKVQRQPRGSPSGGMNFDLPGGPKDPSMNPQFFKMNGMDPNIVGGMPNGMRPPSSHPGGFPNQMTSQQLAIAHQRQMAIARQQQMAMAHQQQQAQAAAVQNWQNGPNGQMMSQPAQSLLKRMSSLRSPSPPPIAPQGNAEPPPKRIKRICVSYTISEDMSGDRGNEILSRISEKKRNSCEVRLRERGSHGDRWNLKHQRKAVGDANGALDQYDISGFKYVNPQEYPEISSEIPRNPYPAEEPAALLSNKEKLKRRKGAGHLQRDCANCHTRVTPEWTRGPSGQKDLCNSCGLRWAKSPSWSQELEALEEPSDFLSRTMGTPTVAVSPSISIPSPATLNNHRLSTSSFNIQTPSTPTSDSLTTATTLTSYISQQRSRYNDSMLQDLEMMNCNSQSSFSTDINDQFMSIQVTPKFSSSRHSWRSSNEEQSKLLAAGASHELRSSHPYQIQSSRQSSKMGFPGLKGEARNREMLLKDPHRISRLPDINTGGKRSRDQDDGVRRQKPRIEYLTGLTSLIPDVVPSWPSHIHSKQVKREIVEID